MGIPDKKVIITILGLVGFGLGFLFLGLYTIYIGNLNYDEAIQSDSLKPIPINDERWAYLQNSKIHTVVIKFQTNDVFAVNNPLNYTILARVDNPQDFDKIIAINVDSRTDPSIIESILKAENNGTVFPKTILTKNSNDEFVGSEINLKKTSETMMGFVLIAYSNEVVRGTLLLNTLPLVIYPATAEYQAQTNRDIQKQNIESGKTNANVEGLTYVLIGLVPIGMFIQLLIDKRILTI